MRGSCGRLVLDLRDVTLPDVDVVRFLGVCETRGVELVHCAPHIREWIPRERGEYSRELMREETGPPINGQPDGLIAPLGHSSSRKRCPNTHWTQWTTGSTSKR